MYNDITYTHKKNYPKNNNNNKNLYRNTFTQRNNNENGNPYSKIVAQVKKFNLDGKLLIGRNLVSSYKPQEEPQFFLWSTTQSKKREKSALILRAASPTVTLTSTGFTAGLSSDRGHTPNITLGNALNQSCTSW